MCGCNELIKLGISGGEVLGTKIGATQGAADRFKLGVRKDQKWDPQIVPLKVKMVVT